MVGQRLGKACPAVIAARRLARATGSGEGRFHGKPDLLDRLADRGDACGPVIAIPCLVGYEQMVAGIDAPARKDHGAA
ncbi:hypothetical protein P0F65_21820 [Sphingomonas sp. I4]